MKLELILSDLTLDIAIEKMNKIMNDDFRINNFEYHKGKATRHSLINTRTKFYGELKNFNRRPMILLSYNGSSTISLYEGDKLVFSQHGLTVITTNYKNEKVVYTFEKMEYTKNKRQQLIRGAELNKELSEDYFSAVTKEYEIEDMFGSEAMYDYYD